MLRHQGVQVAEVDRGSDTEKGWFERAFQRDEERRILSLRNLTSFRDVLAVPSNG